MRDAFPKIIIENGVFKRIPAKVRAIAKTFAIITDSNLKRQGQELLRLMRNAKLKCNLVVLPAGEETKSLSVVGKAAEHLVRLGIKRDSCIIALGGGVIGDAAGFLAAIYMRGIPFVSVPTTLLAMADSGIGGKTGVDMKEGKNLLGAFCQPKMVIVDISLLRTLNDRAFKNGMAEIIKHGIIADKSFFNFLEKNVKAILSRKLPVLKKIIAKSINIKMNIVRKDEKESIKKLESSCYRMLLNYGHTVGHALEKLSGYKLPHGEAVAIGMVAENRVAVGHNLLKEKGAKRIYELIKAFGLPVKIPSQYSSAEIKKALESDKKNINGKLYFALPARIGKAVIKAL